MNIYDDTTELYYLNSRYYNPEDGRFITEDTYTGEYSEPSSLHLYTYCQNNPVNNIDPTGNFPWAIVSAAWAHMMEQIIILISMQKRLWIH